MEWLYDASKIRTLIAYGSALLLKQSSENGEEENEAFPELEESSALSSLEEQFVSGAVECMKELLELRSEGGYE